MKILAYEVREDEKPIFKQLAQAYGFTLKMTKEYLVENTAKLAKGFDGVTFLSVSKLNQTTLDTLAEMGVKYIATRSVGINHIDANHALQLGMRIGHAKYPPYSVAEFTVMLILMTLRHAKPIIQRVQINDFSLQGLRGQVLRNLTVGIIGAGDIGAAVIENLSGFGCEILAYDLHGKVPAPSKYTALDELFAKSDIISLHIPLTKETTHLINRQTIAKMKEGVILINVARGKLEDTEAIIAGIESGKIGALGLDVLEGEEGIFLSDLRTKPMTHKNLAYLRQFPNVVMTPHIAFYTDVSTKYMVEHAVKGLLVFYKGDDWEYEINGMRK